MDNWIEQYKTFASKPWSPTTLSNQEEKAFRSWIQGTQLFNSIKKEIADEQNVPVNKLNNSRILEMMLGSKDYDYRGAWKAGVKEEISPYDNLPHWPSSTEKGVMLKSPQHPTTWKEFFMRQYSIDPDELGLSTYDKAIDWTLKKAPVVSPFYSDPFNSMPYLAP